MSSLDTAERQPAGHLGMLRAALLLILAAVLTVTLQRWVGSHTIYDKQLAEQRLAAHNAILHNEPPLGRKWHETGTDRLNVRILTIRFAEGVHRATGAPVLRVYQLLDTAALFCVFLLLFTYLGACLPAPFALIGLLYFAIATTLTYHLHFFHPWDRLSLLCWILGIILIRDDRYLALLVLLPLAVMVKWDIIALPVLYWLVHRSRAPRVLIMMRTLALAAASIVTLVLLARVFPGGADRFDTGTLLEITRWQLSHNWQDFVTLHVGYPPLLAFGLPLLLAGFGLRPASHFLRATFLFALVLLVPLMLSSNFAEVRAQMMILALLLPTALIGLIRVLSQQRFAPLMNGRAFPPSA